MIHRKIFDDFSKNMSVYVLVVKSSFQMALNTDLFSEEIERGIGQLWMGYFHGIRSFMMVYFIVS